MTLTDREVILFAAILTGLGPLCAGTAAWVAARRNATQASVDKLHDCLEAHTAQDEANFGTLNRNLAALKKQVNRRAQEIKGD